MTSECSPCISARRSPPLSSQRRERTRAIALIEHEPAILRTPSGHLSLGARCGYRATKAPVGDVREARLRPSAELAPLGLSRSITGDVGQVCVTITPKAMAVSLTEALERLPEVDLAGLRQQR